MRPAWRVTLLVAALFLLTSATTAYWPRSGGVDDPSGLGRYD
jgi:hypothetical protein